MAQMASTPSGETFEDLVAEARAGSSESLDRVLAYMRRLLLRRATRSLGPDLREVGASDVVQDTLMEAHIDIGSFRGHSREEFLAWLCQILHHNIQNVRRHYQTTAKRQIAREVPLLNTAELARCAGAGPATPSAALIQDERSRQLDEAIEELPPVQRSVLRLRLKDQYTFGQIGGFLHCSGDAARKLWARAVRGLARRLR